MLTFASSIRLFFVLVAALLLADIFLNIPFWLYIAVFLLQLLALVYGSATIQSNFYIRAICKGPLKNQVAITFDDGPYGESTDAILDILKANNVLATFFCIGDRITTHPELIQRIHREGHLVGNHSKTHHPLIDFSSRKKWVEEITVVNQQIQELTRETPRFFRPPYGVTTPHLAKAVQEANMLTIGWNLRSFDTVTDSLEKLLSKIRRQVSPGSILLFHDSASVTVQGLQHVLDFLREQGLQPVRLDLLIDELPYQ